MGVVGYSIQQEWGSFQSHPLIERDVVVEDLAVMRDTVSPREVDGAEISRWKRTLDTETVVSKTVG